MKLDDAYAIAAYTANFEAYPPRWAAEAAALRKGLGERALLGQAYGPGPRQAYDLFLPPSDPLGTVVFIHGGYWRAFDRTSWSYLAAGPLARGWAVAMPSYDLCPQVRIADITRQISKAVQSVASRTTGPLAITGHSAGGHLAARMLDRSLLPAEVAARLTAIIPISPLSDLRPLMQTAMNDDFRLDDAAARAESPVSMTSRYDAPVTVWVGANERPALLDQARWLAEAWHSDHIIVPERHHFDIIDALEDPKSDLVRRLTA